ncbi:MAG TPA: hypothetical protein VJU13_02920 [Candidatus Nitrosocosmicus sp.]|nr:hypothetical protein [Candidatus Nitrosocosmicus sp.]
MDPVIFELLLVYDLYTDIQNGILMPRGKGGIGITPLILNKSEL